MMKMKLIKILVLITISFSGMSQIIPSPVQVVSAPTLEGLVSTLQAQQAAGNQLVLNEQLMKRATGFVVNMSTTKKLIETINRASCSLHDFQGAIGLAQQSGFWNCWLDNQTNTVINQLMAAVDIANMAMASYIDTDAGNRVDMIATAVDKYVIAEGSMRTVAAYVLRKVREKNEKIAERNEKVALAGIEVKY